MEGLLRVPPDIVPRRKAFRGGEQHDNYRRPPDRILRIAGHSNPHSSDHPTETRTNPLQGAEIYSFEVTAMKKKFHLFGPKKIFLAIRS